MGKPEGPACRIYNWRLKASPLQWRHGIAFMMQSTDSDGPRYFVRRSALRFEVEPPEGCE